MPHLNLNPKLFCRSDDKHITLSSASNPIHTRKRTHRVLCDSPQFPKWPSRPICVVAYLCISNDAPKKDRQATRIDFKSHFWKTRQCIMCTLTTHDDRFPLLPLSASNIITVLREPSRSLDPPEFDVVPTSVTLPLRHPVWVSFPDTVGRISIKLGFKIPLGRCTNWHLKMHPARSASDYVALSAYWRLDFFSMPSLSSFCHTSFILSLSKFVLSCAYPTSPSVWFIILRVFHILWDDSLPWLTFGGINPGSESNRNKMREEKEHRTLKAITLIPQ